MLQARLIHRHGCTVASPVVTKSVDTAVLFTDSAAMLTVDVFCVLESLAGAPDATSPREKATTIMTERILEG